MNDSDANAHDDLSQRSKEPAPLTPAAVLRAAADLIEPEGRWTQGAWAKSAKGNVVDGNGRYAVCWCLDGAIERALPPHDSYDLWASAVSAVRRIVGGGYITWNDRPGRTQAEVVAALRAAALLADGALGRQEPDAGSALVMNQDLSK